MESETPRKKLAEMSLEERRTYNAQAKARSRERLKQKTCIPNASEFVMPERWESDLRQYVIETEQAIRSELADLTDDDIHIIAAACSVLRGLETNYEQTVTNPMGILVSGYFPDALGAEIVEHVHKYPNILASPSFKGLYESLLREIARWARKNQEYVTAQFIADVQAAIDGKYVLFIPVMPEPSPEPPAPEPPRLPTDAEVLQRSRIQLLESLHGPLDTTAHQYLYGAVR